MSDPRRCAKLRVRRGSRSLRLRSLALVLLLLAVGPALAHADYLASDPPRDAVLAAPPTQVELTYTEPAETRFSVFKVYRLDHPTLDDATLAQPDFLRLNGLAGLLVADVLQLRGDEEARADLGLVDPEPRTDRVVLALKPDLADGAYVVMWRVLATDTHPTQGHFVFVVSPDGSASAAIDGSGDPP